MRNLKQFRAMSWDHRRLALLGDVIDATKDLDAGRIPHVSHDMRNVYVHFYRANKELGDLAFAVALDALWNDTYSWYDCGKENRRGERGELDLRDADTIKLQTH